MIDEADVLTYLGRHLANYKIPRQVTFQQAIFQTDLPREDSGKIFKRQLRKPFWKDRQVRI
jgi:long-chain acyl-CoA synthetase